MCVCRHNSPTRWASTHISGACKYKAVLDLITRRAQCSKSLAGRWGVVPRRTSNVVHEGVVCGTLAVSHVRGPCRRTTRPRSRCTTLVGGGAGGCAPSAIAISASHTGTLHMGLGMDRGGGLLEQQFNCYRLFPAYRPRVHFLCTATKGAATLGSGLGSGRVVTKGVEPRVVQH